MMAIIIYEIGQIITGAAAGPNAVIQMIIGWAIAGVGNGGIITLLFVVVTDIVAVNALKLFSLHVWMSVRY
jgi:MFS family permease